MGKVDEMVDEKIEAPKRLYVQIFGGEHAACYLDDPRKVHDNGKPVYRYILIDTPNTNQRAERAAANIAAIVNRYYQLHPRRAMLDELADIIAAEFER